MIYTSLTVKAMNIAYQAHHGQLDRGGVPYIFHPLHLAEQMKDEYTTCVALLHDTLEDTALTSEDLRKEFPEEIVEAIELMTHDPKEPYEDYVRRAASNPLSRAVKIADVLHNSDPERRKLAKTDAVTQARLTEKYAKAREILGI